MTEVLVEFDTTIVGADGTRWVPSVCGAVADDGLWEGWIEFAARESSVDPIRTPRETQQPNRVDLMYWAQGLSQAYLEEALRRAVNRPRTQPRPAPASRPRFDAPAPRDRPGPSPSVPRPILNPFEVYQQGENVLRSELSALSTAHLRGIVVAYRLSHPTIADDASREGLTTTILAGVRRVREAEPAPRSLPPD